MALKVKSKASKAHLGEEDWGGLEGPADVIAIAMDHADDGFWRGVEGLPCSGEEGEASGGGVEGLGAMDALGSVVFLLFGATPVVGVVLHLL